MMFGRALTIAQIDLYMDMTQHHFRHKKILINVSHQDQLLGCFMFSKKSTPWPLLQVLV